MVYQSMYRRFRPHTFSEMIGQNHVTHTLSNALSRGQLSHAYLFCGPRGTGKTTAARIMARAMNCETYPVSEPCGKCNSCQHIKSGISIDVVEMDAASNRGIDEIRDLREKSRYASAESRYKVYIIDEAHMLTTEACNAFLKTLEDPPQNVVFILATTDPSKLPTTIVSRCQRFDFRLLPVGEIVSYLAKLVENDNYDADSEALQLIGRLAGGSLRDALGILEKCYSYSDKKLEASHVRAVTGSATFEDLDSLMAAVVENNFDKGLKALQNISLSGCDLNMFLKDLTFICSRLLLDAEVVKDGNEDLLQGFAAIIRKYHGVIQQKKLFDLINLLYETAGEMKNTYFPQFILEIALIRILRLLYGQAPQLSSECLQEKPVVSEYKPAEIVAAKVQESEYIQPETDQKKPTGEHLEKLIANWAQIINQVKKQQKSTAAWLEPATLTGVRGQLVQLSYSPEYSIHQLRIMENSHRKIVEEVLSAFCQKPFNISAVIVENAAPPSVATDMAQDEAAEKPKASDEAKMLFGGTLIDLDEEEG